MHVLIVDDDEAVAESCRRVLEMEDITVEMVGTVDAALRALDRAPSADLVLTDIKMPGREGYDLIPLARQINPELKFLVMTGFQTREARMRSMASGADGWIGKPFSPDELLDAVWAAANLNTERKHP
jgi:two-component system C4-dicarboxylate transport response regulator DctD